ncbi:MAG: EF2563 family selenium-dependent molybdenum hydroxylase system protein [Ruminococcus sp.]|nr:EF2563 family selenium-dependent molybdenum hydroxylase system protein [Ruminococcus sp.]
MFALIRGAGDLASGIALRLWHSGFDVVMTDTEHPTTIRRTVAFSQAIVKGRTDVEDVSAQKAENVAHAVELLKRNILPVFIDPECKCRHELRPDIIIDAILAKRNLGTKITDAPIVIGVGPGFEAAVDCHAVIETMRGHTLGRAIYKGCALPNTNIPGLIGGFAGERVLRAPDDGIFIATRQIGDAVDAGDIVGYVGDKPMECTISGVLRGLLADGTKTHKGMKAGDVDPRGKKEYCYTVSDKALAIAGGVLEAILYLEYSHGREIIDGKRS